MTYWPVWCGISLRQAFVIVATDRSVRPFLQGADLARLVMRTFRLTIWSRRHTVPTEAEVTVRDELRAIELAKQRLEDSPDRLAVEVRDGDQVLFWVARGDQAELSN